MIWHVLTNRFRDLARPYLSRALLYCDEKLRVQPADLPNHVQDTEDYAKQKFAAIMSRTAALEIKDEYKQPWLEHTYLEAEIEAAIRSVRPGVNVLLGPPGMAKTSRVKTVAKRMYETGLLEGVVYFDCGHCKNSLRQSWVEFIGINRQFHNVNSLLPAHKCERDVLLIFDQVEKVHNCEDFKDFFRGLATSSCNGSLSHFFVIAICSEASTAEDLLLLNGGVKLFPLINGELLLECKLKKQVCSDFVRDRCASLNDSGTQPWVEQPWVEAQDWESVQSIAALAGTVGMCRQLAYSIVKGSIRHDLHYLRKRAKNIDAHWKDCCQFEHRVAQRQKKNSCSIS